MTPHLSAFKEAGSLVFVSGQLAFDATRVIRGITVAEQTTQVMTNISTVLMAAGLKIQDVVKTTVWLRRASDFADFDASYASYLGQHRPARSTVIGDLVLAQALVEIEAIAIRGS